MTRLSDAGEDGLLAELARAGLAHGIADDVAVLDGGRVVTQDALLEGFHFRLEWTSWRDLGYKAAAVNLSDLAAAGAEVEALLVTLAAPAATPVESIVELYEGLNEAGVPVVGGDTSAADRVLVCVTALGRSERVPGRGGARPGDRLVVTGPLGAAAAGFHALRLGIESPLVDAHRRPPIRLAAGRRLAARAHALMDLSDGLAADAARMAARSGCRVVVELDRVPVADGVADLAAQAGLDVAELVAGFGEDYELLAAVDDPGDLAQVGFCADGTGLEIRSGGRAVELAGWDHFRSLA